MSCHDPAVLAELFEPVRARGQCRQWPFASRFDAAAGRLLAHPQARHLSSAWTGEQSRAYLRQTRGKDERLAALLDDHCDWAVLELAAGLSTRRERLKVHAQHWFCADLPPLYATWNVLIGESSLRNFLPAVTPCQHWLRFMRRRANGLIMLVEREHEGSQALLGNWTLAASACFGSAVRVIEPQAPQGVSTVRRGPQGLPRRQSTQQPSSAVS